MVSERPFLLFTLQQTIRSKTCQRVQYASANQGKAGAKQHIVMTFQWNCLLLSPVAFLRRLSYLLNMFSLTESRNRIKGESGTDPPVQN